MQRYQGYIIIKRYQLEDTVNILLNNNYIVEIKNNDENTFIINIYKETDDDKNVQ